MVLLANEASAQSITSPIATGTSGLSIDSILRGVDAAEISDLPPVWQQIADRSVTVGHHDPDFLVALARLFYTKATDRSAEVFQQGAFQQSTDFQSFYEKGARETLEFFGYDFIQSAYPDFERALETARAQETRLRCMSAWIQCYGHTNAGAVSCFTAGTVDSTWLWL